MNVPQRVQTDASLKEQATRFMNHPIEFFGYSVTNMHSIPRDSLEELQAKALSLRFEQQKELIPALARLADGQGIRSIHELNEVLPVCFEHTVRKSYPLSLLERNRFDKMTSWLNKITSHDLSSLDASGCDSIDAWLDLIVEKTGLDPVCSSGTTGTMSFTPRDKNDWRTSCLCLRTHLLQKFGEPPTDDALNERLHVIVPGYADGHNGVYRRPRYLREYFAFASEDHFHPRFPARVSTDLMFLAARLRAAAARGDARVDVAPSLLARRDELEQMRKDMAGRQDEWVRTLTEDLTGKRVIGYGTWNLFYEVAHEQLQKGRRCHFAPNSVLMWGGGAKGLDMPENWQETVKAFFNLDLAAIYGMSELNSYHMMCPEGRYHTAPWSIPFVLDPDTAKPFPRHGVQTGRAVFFDVSSSAHWGGLISGDEIEMDWEPCACGRTTAHISKKIRRYSEIQGGDDKITCAATPQAHADAMDFITSL
jgi:hypothetical protein